MSSTEPTPSHSPEPPQFFFEESVPQPSAEAASLSDGPSENFFEELPASLTEELPAPFLEPVVAPHPAANAAEVAEVALILTCVRAASLANGEGDHQGNYASAATAIGSELAGFVSTHPEAAGNSMFVRQIQRLHPQMGERLEVLSRTIAAQGDVAALQEGFKTLSQGQTGVIGIAKTIQQNRDVMTQRGVYRGAFFDYLDGQTASKTSTEHDERVASGKGCGEGSADPCSGVSGGCATVKAIVAAIPPEKLAALRREAGK